MTNQLTLTDTTRATVRPPIQTSASTFDDRPMRPSGGRRWILICAGAALTVATVVGFAVTGNDSTESAQAETSAPGVNRGVLPPHLQEFEARVEAEQRLAYLIIANEIDAALAERDAAADLNIQRPASVIIQDEIDSALAELRPASGE